MIPNAGSCSFHTTRIFLLGLVTPNIDSLTLLVLYVPSPLPLCRHARLCSCRCYAEI